MLLRALPAPWCSGRDSLRSWHMYRHTAIRFFSFLLRCRSSGVLGGISTSFGTRPGILILPIIYTTTSNALTRLGLVARYVPHLALDETIFRCRRVANNPHGGVHIAKPKSLKKTQQGCPETWWVTRPSGSRIDSKHR